MISNKQLCTWEENTITLKKLLVRSLELADWTWDVAIYS